MDDRRLLNSRKVTLSKMPRLEESIKGSLVIMSRFCGKPNCRCKKGQKHKSVYLSQSHKSRTRMIYIPQAIVEKIAMYIKNYLKAKKILNTVSDINIKLLTRK
jgi:hypothetical protein